MRFIRPVFYLINFISLFFLANIASAETSPCKHDDCSYKSLLKWQLSLGAPVIAAPAVYNDITYVSAGNSLHAINNLGEEIWSYNAGDEIGAKVIFVKRQKPFLLLHADNGLHALNLLGKKIWFYPAKDHNPIVEGKSWGWGDGEFEDPWGWYRSVPLVSENTVYFGAGNGVYAVNLDNGSKIWYTKTGAVGTRAVPHESNIIVGSWDNHLYSLNAKSGKITWKFKGASTGWIGNDGFHLSPTVANNVVYAGSRDTYFYAIDANSGKQLWSKKEGGSWLGSQALIVGSSVLYGLSDGNAVVQRDLKTGEMLAKYDTKMYTYAQPLQYNNKLIVASMSGELLTIDLASRKINRIFQTPQSQKNFRNNVEIFTLDPAKPRFESEQLFIAAKFKKLGALLNITISGDVAYVGSGNGTVYALSLKTIAGGKEANTGTLMDYDNNEYAWVRIGSQVWMAENLAVTHYANGKRINNGKNINEGTIENKTKYWVAYNHELKNKNVYGLLYTWTAALNGQSYGSVMHKPIQGICPDNWHVPHDKEWQELEQFLGVPEAELDLLGGRGISAGGKLKSTNNNLWALPNMGATNESGFNALPAGYYLKGKFDRIGKGTYFWAPKGDDDDLAINHNLRYNEMMAGRGRGYKKSAFSIRCVRNSL